MAQSQRPLTVTILGATGDLTQRKLMPALAALASRGALGDRFTVVGFSRRPLDTEGYRRFLTKSISNLGHHFLAHLTYVQGDLTVRADYRRLAENIFTIDARWKTCADKIFYLATPPNHYEVILRHLHASGVVTACERAGGRVRIAIEKPFGRDLATAQKLDALLGKLFPEHEIYRVDHYLGKETVQNILNFRFSNAFTEPTWTRDHITRIEARLWEAKPLVGRGEFYDVTGALRDVGQNHLLQLLALMLADNPISHDSAALQAAKATILEALPILGIADIRRRTARAQYRRYRRTPGVSRDSKMETYFRVVTELNHPRYAGIPMVLEAGKGMARDLVEIRIIFREPVNCYCQGPHQTNEIVYRIQPDEGIEIQFLIKQPGQRDELRTERFNFTYRESFGNAYERILLDIVRGDQMLFVSTREILASWRFITPIVRAWAKGAAPLQLSGKNFEGLPTPLEAQEQSPPALQQVGMIGLGRMGINLARRLREQGYDAVGFNRSKGIYAELRDQLPLAETLPDLIRTLKRPRLVWLMVSHEAVDAMLDELLPLLAKGDTVIDGGNSFYQQSIERYHRLRRRGLRFIDVGVSGGPGGALTGPVLLVGGDERTRSLEPLFRDLATIHGYAIFGQPGAGHFVKMVHNGIEYGMMQSLGEGFAVMQRSRYQLDFEKIADVFNHGSVIESRLVGWLREAFRDWGQDLHSVSGSVAHTGEGRWTVEIAKRLGVSVPAIETALRFRVRSAKAPSFLGKILSALRGKFGRHQV